MGYEYPRAINRMPQDKFRYWTPNESHNQEYVFVDNGFYRLRNWFYPYLTPVFSVLLLYAVTLFSLHTTNNLTSDILYHSLEVFLAVFAITTSDQPATIVNFSTKNVLYLFSIYYIYTHNKWNSLILCTAMVYYFTLCYWIGVHRMWCHKAFKAHWSVRLVMAVGYTATVQGSIFSWCRGHRVHHKHSDTDSDPHNIRRGLLFAHYGWAFLQEHPDVARSEAKYSYDDYESDWVARWQRRNYWWLILVLNLGVIPYMHYVICGDNYSESFMYFSLRSALVQHGAAFINSAAHLFGDRPYNKDRPYNIMTLGEGYHNFHHEHPYDYRQSEMSTVGLNFSALLIE